MPGMWPECAPKHVLGVVYVHRLDREICQQHNRSVNQTTDLRHATELVLKKEKKMVSKFV